MTNALVPISQKSGLDLVCEVNEVYTSGSKVLLREALGLELIAGAAAVYAFGITAVVKFLYYAIIVLAKVIKTVIEKCSELLGSFTKYVNHITSSNEAALQESAIDVEYVDWQSLREGIELEREPIQITGFRMDFDVDTILKRYASENFGAYDAIYFNLLNEGKDIFESRSHMLDMIAEHRAHILNVPSVTSKMSTVEFADALKKVVFGSSEIVLSYSYKDAKAIDKENRGKTTHIQNLLKSAIVDARNGLKALEVKRSEIQRNPESSTESIKDNFQIQLNWLIEYRTTMMKDQIMIFDTLIKYIKMVNMQTKLIRAKAIETQWEG